MGNVHAKGDLPEEGKKDQNEQAKKLENAIAIVNAGNSALEKTLDIVADKRAKRKRDVAEELEKMGLKPKKKKEE